MSKNVLLAGFSLLAFVGGNAFADHLGEGMSGRQKDTPQAAAPRRTVIYKEDLE